MRLKWSHSFLLIESYRHCGNNRSHFADHRFWQKDDTFVGALLLGARAAGGILSHSFTLKIIFHIMNKCMGNSVIKGCE